MNFGVTKSLVKIGMGTVEKLTLENMGIAFGILSVGLGGTESTYTWGCEVHRAVSVFEVSYKNVLCKSTVIIIIIIIIIPWYFIPRV